MNLDNARKTFFLESRENLQRVEENLLSLEENAHDEEFINALFREVHTIKGSAGMFGFDDISEFAHIFENLLDSFRKHEIDFSQELIDVSLDSHDYLKEIINIAESGDTVSDEIRMQRDAIRSRIQSILQHPSTEETAADAVPSEAATKQQLNQANGPSDVDEDEDRGVRNRYWHISLRFEENSYTSGIDPFSFIQYLKSIGTLVNVVTITDSVPPLETYDPEKCYLGFEIDLDAPAGTTKQDLVNVFEFLTDDSHVVILPPHSAVDHYRSLIEATDDAVQLGELLVQSGTLTKNELRDALRLQDEKYTDSDSKKALLGEVIVREKMVEPDLMEAALAKQRENRTKEERTKRSIRVDAEKIDQLITLVGELVISGANIQQRTETTDDTELSEAVALMARLVDEIRDASMNIRMVPIGETFATFRRTVHDLSKQMNKDVAIEIYGGDTELDKTLVEKIGDPLMHLVRNAVDHGIEPQDERVVSGKDTTATITLNAYHESGSIVIEVTDDGRGLDREKILAKAIEHQLVEPNQSVSDRELWSVIMMPGFSTTEQVTGVSGRGVGMDVVKRNIESLRGIIDIESVAGKGTTFRIHLPLTLAIIDGFLVTVRGQHFVFPLDMVLECTDADEEKISYEGGHFFTLREEVLPFMNVGNLFFGEDDAAADGSSRENRRNKKRMVIVEYARKRAGLVVDELLGEFQTVIKPLGKLFHDLKWISGATILGSGDVALIIDVPRLIAYIREQSKTEKKRVLI
ncbi:MAG: chemotaxis protein CheA [Spirochaetota bacterium]